MIVRLCIVAGCPNARIPGLATCTRHYQAPVSTPEDKQRYKEYNAFRRSDSVNYQSKDWTNLRKSFIGTNPRCNGCGITAQLVHHKLPTDTHPDLFLDWGNLESLCRKCHGKRHRKKDLVN